MLLENKLTICIGFIKVRVESSSLARHLVSRQFEFYQEAKQRKMTAWTEDLASLLYKDTHILI